FLHENTRSQRFPRDVTETFEQRYRSKYLTYPEILRFLQYVNTSSNVNVQVGSIGKSFEGRDMPFIKIQSNDSWPGKRTIFIDAGVHSREWISPAMAVEIIHRLALNTEKDRAVNKLLEMFDWLIVPLVNPDGYVQTFSKGLEGRMWRKNRNKRYSTNPLCYGVDLNRNFGFQWNNSPEHGGSSNPCSGTFSGPRSFSEPETLNMGRLLLSNKDHIAGYISFHSFGQFFLYPWGFSSDVNIEDEPDLHHVASAFVDRMKRKDYIYNLGGSAKTLYPAAGGSDDYVRGVVGVKYAYTVELPPHENSRYGFLLPETEVKSVVSDTWEGLKSFAFRLHQHTRATPFNTTQFRPVTNASDQQKDLLEEVSYRTIQNALKGNFMDTLLNSITSEKRYNRYRKSRARTNKKIRLHLSSKTN
ncbi:carboxypeptidase B, partial [Biomphalaria glabrata]